MGKYISEIKAEFLKIVWPSKDEVINATALVIGLSLAAGVYLGAFDYVFATVVEFIKAKLA